MANAKECGSAVFKVRPSLSPLTEKNHEKPVRIADLRTEDRIRDFKNKASAAEVIQIEMALRWLCTVS